MYEKIKKWYKQGLWTEAMVNNAVIKGALNVAVSINSTTVMQTYWTASTPLQ